MNEFEELMQATGTLAEITSIFYNAIIDKVGSEQEAYRLTGIFINSILYGKNQKG